MESTPWTDGLLSDTRDVVRRLLGERLWDHDELRREVVAYRAQVSAAARPYTDVQQAEALSVATLALLDRTAAEGPRARRLAQVAARYFVLQDDGDDDLSSPFGFDDDIEVFNAVVTALGQPHHAIRY